MPEQNSNETGQKMSIGEADELYHTMFDTAPVGLTIIDENYNIIDCNETVLAIYGVSKEYYINQFYSLSPEHQPDGKKSSEKMRELIERTLSGETIKMEWMHCTPEGEPLPCEITLARANYKGRPVGFGYMYDLRHYKILMDNIHWLEKEVDKMLYANHTDALTGIYNRRYFDENIDLVISNSSRSGGMLSLFMVDIDYFKKYNDTYGHNEGDVCLKSIAETLSNSLSRATDFVARYGGEEFAVVLPNTDENGARIIAEKLLENVRNRNIPHEKSEVADYVTVSIGVATGTVNHKQCGAECMKRADEMLYLSKQNGRNQYSFAKL